ncbi:MAG: glycosyltransferase family 4 protein [Candidatus Promineifilaceae bacterium]
MKIAYILKMYPRFSETFIVNEILELERQGVDVRIYSLRKPDDGRFHAKLARVKANVIYTPEYPDKEPDRVQAAEEAIKAAYPARYQAVRTYAESRGHAYAIKRFQQACVIAAHLLKHPVHAMHAHFATSASRVSNLIYQLIGLPYSITAHAKDIFHEDVKPDSLQGKIRDARFVITVSQFNRRYLQELMGNEPADIRCLYNGIDLSHFRPDPTTSRKPNLILGVGRLVEKKGFDTLIHACALLRNWGVSFQCHIIGKGDSHDTLKALIEQYALQNQVRLMGPQPQEAVLAAYHQATIFALPCVVGKDGNRDGLPTVLLEAMACKIPVVSTPVTGNPEIIDDGVNGRIVPPNNAEALAEALADLLQNPQKREVMGTAARQKVTQTFNVQKNVAILHNWLAEPTHKKTAKTETETAVPPPIIFKPKAVIIDSPFSPVQDDYGPISTSP